MKRKEVIDCFRARGFESSELRLRTYFSWLEKFGFYKCPDIHKKAWKALVHLKSSYHRSGPTDELIRDLQSGLLFFERAKG